MIDPDALLAVARELAQKGSGAGRLLQARLRRADSTAYYAMFHALMRAIANEFISARHAKSDAWRNAYRSLDHADIKRIPKGTAQFGAEIQNFIRSAHELQERRLAADYDPSLRLTPSDVQLNIFKAENAISALNAAPSAMRRDFLASIVFPARK